MRWPSCSAPRCMITTQLALVKPGGLTLVSQRIFTITGSASFQFDLFIALVDGMRANVDAAV